MIMLALKCALASGLTASLGLRMPVYVWVYPSSMVVDASMQVPSLFAERETLCFSSSLSSACLVRF